MDIRINKTTGKVVIIQTHGGEGRDMENLVEFLNGKRIAEATISDHPDDKGGVQSPRQVIAFRLSAT